MLSAFETGKHMPATRSIIAVLDALGADFGDLQRALDQIAGRRPKYPEADPEFRATLQALAKTFDSLALMLRTLAGEEREVRAQTISNLTDQSLGDGGPDARELELSAGLAQRGGGLRRRARRGLPLLTKP
jgi:hypothetical protein